MTFELENVSAEETQQLGRRTVLKGAAWSVPVMAAATALPLAAASNDPCVPPTVPTQTSFQVFNQQSHQRDTNFNLVDNLDGGPTGKFVRVYADAGWQSHDPNAGWARGTVQLAQLSTAPAVYTITYYIRASFGTQHNNPDWNAADPSHLNSFGTDVRGYVSNQFGQDVGIWSTDETYSTRPGSSQTAGATQIPDVNDDYYKRDMTDVAWHQFSESFEIPAGTDTSNLYFTWDFPLHARTRPFPSFPPGSNNEDQNAETVNDDVDVSYPVFTVTANC